MHMFKEIAIHRSLADCAANKREGKYQERAVIVDMDRQTALWERLDPMGCGVVPGELRRFLRLRRKYVSEVGFMLLLF